MVNENETAVATIPQSPETAVAAQPTLMEQFAMDAGAGSENITSDAMAVPFLRLLQAKSPEVENDPDNYKPGMLVHTITGKRYDIREKGGKPLPFLQAFFEKQIVEWGDKDAGNAGLKARHACNAQTLAVLEKLPRNEKKKPLAPAENNAYFPLKGRQQGNILEETAYHYFVLMPEDEELDSAVLPLKSTGLTPSKKLERIINGKMLKVGDKTFKAPTFSTVFAVQSFLDKQKTGAQNTFMNVRFVEVGMVSDEMAYAMAKEFCKSVATGAAKLDDAAEAAVSGAATEPDAGFESHGSDDDTPF